MTVKDVHATMDASFPEMDLFDLHLLVLLAEGHSLAGASRQLNLSPSALSHRLSRLCQRMNLPSWGTDPQSLRSVLIPALPWLKSSLSHWSQAHRLLTMPQPSYQAVGIARIFSGWAEQLLPDAYQSHRLLWQIQTGTSNDIIRRVENGELKAGLIRTTHGFGTTVTLKTLYQDPLVPIARPDIIETLGSSLESWPWIGFSPTLSHGYTVRTVLATLNIHPLHEIIVDSLQSAQALIRAGRGVAVMPRSLVYADMLQNTLATVETPGVIWPVRTMALIYVSKAPPWLDIWARRILRYLQQTL
ncbi:LysR family transcriptional regulator [Sulfobacillus sp. hq2]|uniref:LysR family transcriptional regulator n=1 Tax=Sulfobacillus TaxID=28033 RepID=UPI000CD32B3C|nr:LysR family transcriptional regulator [Sulfobacillus sp. hq2]POB11671.1 hypothetical protein CO251_03635 [Sulfobacillus sp. hq2]